MLPRILIVTFVLAGLVTTTARSADEIPLTHLNNSNDHININVEHDLAHIDKGEVELVLKLAPKLHWHKKIKAFAGTGFMGEIEVRDDIKTAKLTLGVDQLDHIELGKAGTIGTHWDYKVTDLRGKRGSRITFYWERD